MIALASRPLSSRTALLVAAAIVVLMGVYCLAYNASQGRSETLWNAFSWPVVNLLPFFAAFEAGKRRTAWSYRGCAILATIAISLILDFLAAGRLDIGFEVVRRLPATAAVCALLFLIDRPARSRFDAADVSALPLLPQQIDWISASGNYVILHAPGRRVIHRAALSQVERALFHHGFVRVHRSSLVRRGAVARVRPTDVVLRDGTSVATGARFRAALDEQLS